jgi:hypothetical protein
VPDPQTDTPETEPAATDVPTPPRPRSSVVPPGVLQKETDRPTRPGFREPANKKSKAQKSAKKNKK